MISSAPHPPSLDHDPRALLEVVHETRYAYSSPVSAAQHRLHLQPVQDDRQAVLDWQLEADPASGHRSHAVDVFGNPLTWIQVDQPHSQLLLRSTSRVSVAPPPPWDPQSTQPWEAVRERLRYVAGGTFEPAVEFVQPSPFVPRLGELRDWAAACFLGDEDGLERVGAEGEAALGHGVGGTQELLEESTGLVAGAAVLGGP